MGRNRVWYHRASRDVNGATLRIAKESATCRFVMIDAHTVYVDDSGTDGKSRIVAAAFCVSPVNKWQQFERKWNAIARHAGFKHFHMTEFAACRRDKPCKQCVCGKTSLVDHPWRNWSTEKRKNVLNRLAGAVIEFVEYGVAIAHTKQDYEDHVKNSPARLVAKDPIGDEHFTYAVQKCGGELAKWRAEKNIEPPLKFIFDLATDKQSVVLPSNLDSQGLVF